jgi:hypothetical protein
MVEYLKSEKAIGGEGEDESSKITAEDIIYRDEHVQILKPNIKKVIIVWSIYNQLPETENICD